MFLCLLSVKKTGDISGNGCPLLAYMGDAIRAECNVKDSFMTVLEIVEATRYKYIVTCSNAVWLPEMLHLGKQSSDHVRVGGASINHLINTSPDN